MFPKNLIEKYKDWQNDIFLKKKKHFERLAKEGQSPKYIIISCVDSRVDPNSIFKSEPGELLVHRNIANIVPPYDYITEHSGTIAAIEFGITVLNIKNIIIMGHSGCGGIKNGYQMCKDNGFNSNSSISNWLNLLKPAYKKIDSLTEEDSINELEKISIKTSLENLKNYPFIQERINNKEINIYGSWINIGSGEIETLNFDTASFHPL
ncbi:carbonic anhydrase [Pelagibacterales bacterium SAG-MED32]|nr:carbonic anhydrase [Pelagibacterales bacterium SAG-MED32]